jgi:hypothetical protein
MVQEAVGEFGSVLEVLERCINLLIALGTIREICRIICDVP